MKGTSCRRYASGVSRAGH